MLPVGQTIQPIMSGVAETSKASSQSPTKILSRFHSLMLQQAFKTMLQSDTVSHGKSTLARDVWRDQLAEKLANAATSSGGLTRTPEADKP
jgi:hypothetical protein